MHSDAADLWQTSKQVNLTNEVFGILAIGVTAFLVPTILKIKLLALIGFAGIVLDQCLKYSVRDRLERKRFGCQDFWLVYKKDLASAQAFAIGLFFRSSHSQRGVSLLPLSFHLMPSVFPHLPRT